MATSNHFRNKFTKPGQLLGFFTYAISSFGVCVIFAQLLPLSSDSVWRVESSNRIPALAAWIALVSVIYSAKVAVTNLVRSHTISTLLDSRLSETYMKYGDKVSEGIEKFKENADENSSINNFVDKKALRYLLNYYEFVAVGIRYGELSDEVMRAMLRGIVCRACEVFHEHIDEVRKGNARTYENLLWLRDKWVREDATAAYRKKYVPPVPGAAWVSLVIIFLLACGPLWSVFSNIGYSSSPRDGNSYSESHAFSVCTKKLKSLVASPHLMTIERIDLRKIEDGVMHLAWSQGEIMVANEQAVLRSATAKCVVSGITGEVVDIDLTLSGGL